MLKRKENRGGYLERLSLLVVAVPIGSLIAFAVQAPAARNLTNNPANDANPAWSPDGSKIAFVTNRDGGIKNREIYVMSADGSGQVNLTNNPGDDWDPVWSTDGTQIGFESDRHRRTTAWNFVMNADGSNPEVLTNSSYINGDPAWSHRGNMLVFDGSTGLPGNSDIFITTFMDPAGTAIDGIVRYVAWNLALTHDGLGNRDPVWSPDSSQIAIVSERDENLEIYLMKATGDTYAMPPFYGGEQINLTNSLASEDHPSWSSDGSRIAFESSDRVGHNDIVVIEVEGGEATNLTNSPSVDRRPVFSPIGSLIAFVSERDGNREIYIMRADGSGQTNLTENAGADSDPVWSPDGSKIAFVSDRDGNGEIYVIEVGATP